MTIYSQRDFRWGNKKLGYGDTFIKSYGCTITALAQLLLLNGYDETPATVNDKLKANNGFTGANKNLLVWGAIAKAFEARHIKRDYTYSNAEVLSAIKNYKGCLVEVDGEKIGAPKHWVLYIGNGKALDPWTGKEISTSYYPPLGYSVISVEKLNMPEPTAKFDVNVDLSSEIEADAGLKGYRWYDNKWSFKGLVEYTDSLDRENESLRTELIEAQNKKPTLQEAIKVLLSYIGVK